MWWIIGTIAFVTVCIVGTLILFPKKNKFGGEITSFKLKDEGDSKP